MAAGICVVFLCFSFVYVAAALNAKGIRVMEEQRTLGERMRHAWIWWPGHTREPLRCAQYMFCVRALLDIPACRQVSNVCGGGGQAAGVWCWIMGDRCTLS